ncbi:hypothetical protein COU57_05940 [Candidatus Pacearchaeota archaeon CG10_big_fil_rev_8_21_14_0_10_32_14]|nr:MAG: hypothetical protein COU57_05940 [Candidatus Pacearchaeota archaeon CG10_big_fil_rev_8_21_14_0_10_32_14]
MGDEDSSLTSLSILLFAILVFGLVYLGYLAVTTNLTGYVISTASKVNASFLGFLITFLFFVTVFLYFRKKRGN